MHQRDWQKIFRDLGPIDVLEISPGSNDTWCKLPFRSYKDVRFPEFDICLMSLPETFDAVIADQVFEHLADPQEAARNVLKMLRPGGRFFICTPFLIRVHGRPYDFSRWTEAGLQLLLERAGFQHIVVRSWGNRACVRSYLKNVRRYPAYGFGILRSLSNEQEFPLMVWAVGRR